MVYDIDNEGATFGKSPDDDSEAGAPTPRAGDEKLHASHQRQHELMREAHEAGASLRDIAVVVGVTHETVRTIIKAEQ